MDPSSKTTRLRSRSLKERAEKWHLRELPSRKFRDIHVLAVRRFPFYIQLVASFSWWIPILECKVFKSKDHWCKSRTSRNSLVHLMTLHTSYHVFPPHWSPSPIACGKDKRQALQHGKIDPSAVVILFESIHVRNPFTLSLHSAAHWTKALQRARWPQQQLDPAEPWPERSKWKSQRHPTLICCRSQLTTKGEGAAGFQNNSLH